jgi:hypothetical protein
VDVRSRRGWGEHTRGHARWRRGRAAAGARCLLVTSQGCGSACV